MKKEALKRIFDFLEEKGEQKYHSCGNGKIIYH
jgi:hypothetical protein